MKHYYKIEDSLEIKLIVLETLYQAKKPLTAPQLTHIILGSAKINFFDVHQALDFLLHTNEIYCFRDMEEKKVYALTEEGRVCVKNFYEKIPLAVREYLQESLNAMFQAERQARQLTAKPVPIHYNEYEAQLGLCEGEVPLLHLTLYAGDEALAKKMCQNFRDNAAAIYDTLLELLTK